MNRTMDRIRHGLDKRYSYSQPQQNKNIKKQSTARKEQPDLPIKPKEEPKVQQEPEEHVIVQKETAVATEGMARKMEQDDFLLRQVDEFREKAKQLQELLNSRESKAEELQSIVDEREERAQALQQELEQRQSEANQLLSGVHSQMDEMIERVEEKLNSLSNQIVNDVNDAGQRTAQQNVGVKQSLTDIFAQLDTMKVELSEKIHAEDVKCYRNMKDLIEELEVKVQDHEKLEQGLANVKGYVKCLAWFSIVEFVVLVFFILYTMGAFNF
ncbi:MAG: hypothetical protein IJ567_12000 [Lachnospiraceae bacterium]|nr:hypothetical protein [Lachnospiraceae bacterium]